MKLRIRNTKKFARSISILLGVLLLILLLSKSTYSHGETKYDTRYVASGETLWSIAKEQQLENEYYMNKDIREIVESIKKENGLKNSDLSINQELQIPVL